VTVVGVADYVLHARFHEGRLGDPDARYLFQSRESDDLAELMSLARVLAARGYEAIIYDHGHTPTVSGASDLRTVAHVWPNGRVWSMPGTEPTDTPGMVARCGPLGRHPAHRQGGQP
jgi:hypothetical protein